MPATQELLHQGRYRIEQPFGTAGESTAFSAYDTVSNVNVVVKEIPLKMSKVTTLSQQENIKLAFTNQAQSLKDLRHDSILNVEDFFFDVGRQYLVLESVQGENLQTFLQKNAGPVAAEKVMNWVDQLLNALEFLSSRTSNFVHGKINPGNIYLNADGRVKLVSVGVSATGDVDLDTSFERSSGDSANLCYSPLEQIWDGLDAASQKVISNSYDERSEATLLMPADGRSDVYSLGAVVYHLVTGRKPVDALERSIEMLEGNPDPLTDPLKINPEISSEFSTFILRALEVRRENRFDGAALMRQSLKTTLKLIEERNTAEQREEEEAANDLKMAVTVRQEEVQRIIEAKKQEFEEEKARQEKLLQEKLQAAEEQRLAAERRAAAAERLLQEQEAARKALAAEHAAALSAENDLLQIAVADEPVSQYKFEPVVETVEEEVLTTFEDSSETAENTTLEAEPIEIEVEAEEVQAYGHVIDSEPAVSPVATAYDSYDYAAEEKKPFPMALVAGAAVALAVLIGGLWAAGIFGSSTPTPAPQQAVAVPAEVPAQTEAAVTGPQPETTQQAFATDAPVTQEPAAQPVAATDRPAVAATPKPKKPVAEPVKPKVEPKKVNR
jgi:Serine/threonine protein kinase